MRRRFKMRWVFFTVACKLFLRHLSKWDPKRESCISADTNRLLRRLRAVWDWLEESQFYLLCYSSRSACLTVRRCSASVAMFLHLSVLFLTWGRGEFSRSSCPLQVPEGSIQRKRSQIVPGSTWWQDNSSMGNSDLIQGKRLCSFLVCFFFIMRVVKYWTRDRKRLWDLHS